MRRDDINKKGWFDWEIVKIINYTIIKFISFRIGEDVEINNNIRDKSSIF